MTVLFRAFNSYCPHLSHTQLPTCAMITVGHKPFELGKSSFEFLLTSNGLLPFGFKDAYRPTFDEHCDPNSTEAVKDFFSTMDGCTAWVIYNGNMDYLRCKGKLGWNKARSYDE